MTLITIKKRSEFIRSNKFSKKIYTPNFIIQKLESNKTDNLPHFGFTITKKIGSAIVRNKIKRRIKSIIGQQPLSAGEDLYIKVLRGADKATYSELNKDILNALEAQK